ncbi:hypothetical protein GDO81_008956 [Engystomops pustulosus]|uniref:Uncharacterized protein n=1 Tax=Engystomops pustulosus TaxID=76066 RepID=A0AAV7BNB8_ENGPU|nr:hypothetical protein GDO81_008956 [Engystomops pustulosus]
MRAVRLALLHFSSLLLGQEVLVRSDNLAVVFYINKQGGTKSRSLARECSLLMTWAEQTVHNISAIHIRGVLNVQADWLSRNPVRPSEWSLNKQVFQQIVQKMGLPQIDLMASRSNSQLPQFCSLYKQENPVVVDALSFDWTDQFLYIFPPFPLIPRVLQKIRREKTTIIAVIPFWPRRAWFPLLLSLSKGEFWFLPPRKDLLLQNGFLHPNPAPLHLVAWKLKGGI